MIQKTAVVTGSCGGIGSAVVVALKNKGITCVEVDLLHKNSPDYFQCDFSNIKSVEKVSKIISEKYKKIDYLFNIAGVGIYKNLEDLTLGEWLTSMSVNLNAPFLLTKKLLPNLLGSEKAIVVNVGSGMGVIPSAGRIAYCASKFGLRGLSLSLSKEFANTNLKVAHITLGSVMTSFGTGGIEKRKELAKLGKKYLEVKTVVSKVMAILESDEIKAEYKIYPNGYSKQS